MLNQTLHLCLLMALEGVAFLACAASVGSLLFILMVLAP